jgi:hypothetical protein
LAGVQGAGVGHDSWGHVVTKARSCETERRRQSDHKSDHKSEEKREQQSEEKREPKSELQSEVESELQNEQASDQASEQASEQHESGEKSELRTERSNGFYRYKYFGNTGWGREVHSYERKLE